MAENSKIEWTDTTWNPVTGCSPVSPGCANCYAAQLAATRLKQLPAYEGLATVNSRGQGVFNGTIKLHEDKLLMPLRWRKPRRIFVNSMSDLFHESVPFEFVDRVFAVMALCPKHTFQILTKRPERMAEYLRYAVEFDNLEEEIARAHLWRHGSPNSVPRALPTEGIGWPLPNAWMGTSVEDGSVLSRIDELRQCPATVRFVSFEPLLDDVFKALPLHRWHQVFDGIHWAIIGGESGPNFRPVRVSSIEKLVRACDSAGVPVFVKQDSAARAGMQGDIPEYLWQRKEFPKVNP